MRFMTAIGQKWKRAAAISFSMALLSAVAVVALTLLGSKLLTACKAPGDAEKALASGSAVAGLLNFDSPAATATEIKTRLAEVESNNKKAGESPLLAKNWKYTQSVVLLPAFARGFPENVQELLFAQLNPALIQEVIAFEAFGNTVVALDKIFAGQGPQSFILRYLATLYDFTMAWLGAYNALVTAQGLPSLLAPPLPPLAVPASPFF